MPKTQFAKDLLKLSKGANVDSEFAIVDVNERKTKAGESYLELGLVDSSGRVAAKFWQSTPEQFDAFRKIRYGRARGTVDDFKGIQVILKLPLIDIGIPEDLTDFERCSPIPLADLSSRLDAKIGMVRDQYLSALLKKLLQSPEMREKYINAPAAMENHHAFRHGLVQHSLEVTDLALAVAEIQSKWGYHDRPLHQDMILTGALLHDIGKVFELTTVDGAISYTQQGQLIGHISIGQQLLEQAIATIPNFPEITRNALLHIILSHHGKQEFGSPVCPATPEAQVVSCVDQLDAHLFYFNEVIASASSDFERSRKLENRRVFTVATPADECSRDSLFEND